LTIVFAATLVAVTVIVAERFARVWAPIWIIGMLIGMSILAPPVRCASRSRPLRR
jgi:hypothetical protein